MQTITIITDAAVVVVIIMAIRCIAGIVHSRNPNYFALQLLPPFTFRICQCTLEPGPISNLYSVRGCAIRSRPFGNNIGEREKKLNDVIQYFYIVGALL